MEKNQIDKLIDFIVGEERPAEGVGDCAIRIIKELRFKVGRLEQWVDDLQSGMFVNCVYCGHRYGPKDDVPSSMADVLKEHIEQCSEHPMSALKKENEVLKGRIAELETDSAKW